MHAFQLTVREGLLCGQLRLPLTTCRTILEAAVETAEDDIFRVVFPIMNE